MSRWSVDELKNVLRWIHCDLTDLEFAPLLLDFRKRLSCRGSLANFQHMLPRVAREANEVVAASYFKLLSGNVATLGGVRAIQGREDAAVKLLAEQMQQYRQLGVSQIQAVVREHDAETSLLLSRAGMIPLTMVQHQWLDLSQPQKVPPTPSSNTLGVSWRAASSFASSRFAAIVERTFEKTLDCPAMNGLRDKSEVLAGFLEGRRLRATDSLWEVLEVQKQVAGCVLLQAHGDELVELAYLGLLSEARGQQLGKLLVSRAISQARARRASSLVAAVDEQNWPALALYRDFGFQRQQRLGVWM